MNGEDEALQCGLRQLAAGAVRGLVADPLMLVFGPLLDRLAARRRRAAS